MPSQPTTTLVNAKVRLYAKVTAYNSRRSSLFLAYASPEEVCRRRGDYHSSILPLVSKCIDNGYVNSVFFFNSFDELKEVAEEIRKYAEEKGLSVKLALNETEKPRKMGIEKYRSSNVIEITSYVS